MAESSGSRQGFRDRCDEVKQDLSKRSTVIYHRRMLHAGGEFFCQRYRQHDGWSYSAACTVMLIIFSGNSTEDGTLLPDDYYTYRNGRCDAKSGRCSGNQKHSNLLGFTSVPFERSLIWSTCMREIGVSTACIKSGFHNSN